MANIVDDVGIILILAVLVLAVIALCFACCKDQADWDESQNRPRPTWDHPNWVHRPWMPPNSRNNSAWGRSGITGATDYNSRGLDDFSPSCIDNGNSGWGDSGVCTSSGDTADGGCSPEDSGDTGGGGCSAGDSGEGGCSSTDY